MKTILKTFLVFALISACTLEPKYKRPEPSAPLVKDDEATKKLSQIAWKEYFLSPQLQQVIQTALDNNRDLRVANLNIENAQETHSIARSSLLPTINATALETKQGVPSAFAAFTPRKQFRANLSIASYELDFFGRLRSLKKAALEKFLASREARNITKISLIAQTANSYAQLLCDQEILKVMEENLQTQQQRYNFVEIGYRFGVKSNLDLLTAQSVLESSRILQQNYIKLVKQDKNILLALMGTFDEKLLPQDILLNDIKINEEALSLTPSEMLLNRPDIQMAEHELKSANANIGAARAAFFPSITLSGSVGYGSRELNQLTRSHLWNFTPQINLPIFTGGRNIANLNISNLEKKIEIANYEKAIQAAFQEAANELAQREAVKSQIDSYDKILKSQQRILEVENHKHKSGLSSSPDVLVAQLLFASAKQNQLNAKKEYIANLVNLYKVFGGGSEIDDNEK